MSEYYPPSEYTPVFDVTNFRTTNDNNITQDDADRMYLSRQGVASSLATSTNFLGSVSCGGNLTLNAPTAANRQIEASFLKLVDNASISTNKPLIWNPDPSLQITTNDVAGTIKTIDLKSYNGSVTNVSTSLSCQYGQVSLNGILKITQNTDPTKYSTLTQGALNLTVTNNNSAGNILLNTTSGAIVANTPIVPCNVPPAIFATRPSIGYTYFGTIGPNAITSNTPINITAVDPLPIGVYLFEASLLIAKSTSTFDAAGTSSIRLTYQELTSVLEFSSTYISFENLYPNNTVVGSLPCGLVGGSRILNVLDPTYLAGAGFTVQAASWATYAGSPTYTIRWSAMRVA